MMRMAGATYSTSLLARCACPVHLVSLHLSGVCYAASKLQFAVCGSQQVSILAMDAHTGPCLSMKKSVSGGALMAHQQHSGYI